MSDRFQNLALFVRVADTGSFSRAGRELGYAQPTVSRMIGAMEDRIGVKLLLRTTRKVTPTEAGTALLERARTALAELEDAENAARGTAGFSGVLRIATPVTFGAREIAPRLGQFLESHPALTVELLMADRRVDLLDEGVDLAVRLGQLDDSSFVSRKLASAQRHVVASPTYIARRGSPIAPVDLPCHDIIFGRTPGTQIWTLRDDRGGEASVKLDARIVATSIEGVLASAVAGLGIAAMSSFASRAECDRGDLVRLLGSYTLPSVDVHAILPAGRRPPAKARAFIDFLAATLGGNAAT